MTPQMRLIALFTLIPMGIVIIAALLGGIWCLIALGVMTLLSVILDNSLEIAQPPGAQDGSRAAAETLSVILACGHFAVLFTVIWALSAQNLGLIYGGALFLAAGLFLGQVSNANAHELIHKPGRVLRWLGRMIYVSIGFGHHASAHLLVHHVHVATDQDPNSARLGESYWHFLRRAWIGSFRAGLSAESKRHGHNALRHPYTGYVAGAALWLSVMLALFGPFGAIAYMALCTHSVAQLLLSDYVQHYGLRRKIGPGGKPEPFGPQHSWDSPYKATMAMMLNAPRHSDHHANPMRGYPQLRLAQDGLYLPRSLPIMGAMALWPAKWRAVMDPRVPR